MPVLILVLLATFLANASETDRLACDSFRAVHGARYEKIKRSAQDFLSVAGPDHRANQSFLKRVLPSLKILTKKYKNLLDHLGLGDDTGEMRKILKEEYSTKALKLLYAAGLSESMNLRSTPCGEMSRDICRINADVYLVGDDALPWNPTLEFNVQYRLLGGNSRDFTPIGISNIEILNGSTNLGTAFDAKVRSTQLALDQGLARSESEARLEGRRKELEEAKLKQRMASLTRKQFIEEELTVEQRAACGMVATASRFNTDRMISQARSLELPTAMHTTKVEGSGVVQER